MVKEETIQFIASLKMTYLNYYKDLSKQEYEILIDMWHKDFENIPYKVVMLAFNQYKNSPKGSFPPVSGQLKELILKMSPEEEMSANKAYGLVYKAIRGSAYYDNAVYEYNKLPKEIQDLVSIDRLMQLAKSTSEATLVTFESSFKKDYEKYIKDKKDVISLPLKDQENLLKLKNMNADNFNKIVLGENEQLKLENK